MNNAFLLLGGNLGTREKSLEIAILEIQKRIGRVLIKSSLFETEAWPDLSNNLKVSNEGKKTPDDFLNQAVIIETKFTPQNLMAELLKIENAFGRFRKGEKWSDRIIDIDVLFFTWGQEISRKNTSVILEEENLKIPHPLLHLRRFALMPLNEIAPDFVHPVLKKNISELLAECPDKLGVKKFFNSGNTHE